MLLTEYLENLSRIIDEYSRAGYILSSERDIDIRAENIGLIKASITFIDESMLFVTEYLDLTTEAEKLTYSYHYQDRNRGLLLGSSQFWHLFSGRQWHDGQGQGLRISEGILQGFRLG